MFPVSHPFNSCYCLWGKLIYLITLSDLNLRNFTCRPLTGWTYPVIYLMQIYIIIYSANDTNTFFLFIWHRSSCLVTPWVSYMKRNLWSLFHLQTYINHRKSVSIWWLTTLEAFSVEDWIISRTVGDYIDVNWWR